jgi:hypothetical protein
MEGTSNRPHSIERQAYDQPDPVIQKRTPRHTVRVSR